MYFLAVTSLALFPVFVVGLFFIFPPGRAVFTSYLTAWLYLPLITIEIPGLPDYGKFSAVNIVILPCILIFDPLRIVCWRYSLADWTLVAWIVSPMVSSGINGLGVNDVISEGVKHTLLYGIPYVSGKLYLAELGAWKAFRSLLLLFAVSYLPFCLYEMRMAPVLHQLVYGVPGRSIWESNAMFGPLRWQPTVFMNSAFEVSMMLAMATLFALASLRFNPQERTAGFRSITLTSFFLLFTFFCKKWSVIGLLSAGIVTLESRSRWVFLALFGLPILYMTIFISGLWRGEELVDWIRPFSERRAESLQTRIENDNRLVMKALERPVFGWGGYGRNRVRDENGNDISITDSEWMITLGTKGVFGLLAQTLLFALPCIKIFGYLSRQRGNSDWLPLLLPASLILALHLNDSLFNGFPNSMYPMLAGGLSTIVVKR